MFDPFAYLNAAEDPYIPRYLVGHDNYECIRGLELSAIFAKPGSGKSSFRVRLANACRQGEGNQAIFPIVFNAGGVADEQWEDLIRSVAQEFLLYLFYHGEILDHLSPEALSKVQILLQALPIRLSLYLQQIQENGLEAFISAFDPTASGLPDSPSRASIQALCGRLAGLEISDQLIQFSEGLFDDLINFLLADLRFKAVFILVDGVDAFYETVMDVEQAHASIAWLLQRSLAWQKKGVYLKLFLPLDLKSHFMAEIGDRLTQVVKIATINWDEGSLVHLIRERFQAASGGDFDSFDALAHNRLRNTETLLIKGLLGEKSKATPRDAVLLANHLLRRYYEVTQQNQQLQPGDLDAVVKEV